MDRDFLNFSSDLPKANFFPVALVGLFSSLAHWFCNVDTCPKIYLPTYLSLSVTVILSSRGWVVCLQIELQSALGVLKKLDGWIVPNTSYLKGSVLRCSEQMSRQVNPHWKQSFPVIATWGLCLVGNSHPQQTFLAHSVWTVDFFFNQGLFLWCGNLYI